MADLASVLAVSEHEVFEERRWFVALASRQRTAKRGRGG